MSPTLADEKTIHDHNAAALADLQGTMARRDLVLYLGAGVSIESGLPTWEKLVAAMYFDALLVDSDQAKIRSAYRNYLMAIAEWFLDQQTEPMDITAQKISGYYRDQPAEFRSSLLRTLYMSFLPGDGGTKVSDADLAAYLAKNRTLGAVRRLCLARPGGGSRKDGYGVRAVVSYNYDSLLEIALRGERRCKPIYRGGQRVSDGRLPVFHVHGYLPFHNERGSSVRQIIFTEAQYHATANNPYHWSNLVQLKTMAGHTGLMIGFSMTDRNVRRLLQALRETPVPPKIYAILKTPEVTRLRAAEVRRIRQAARKYLDIFMQSHNLGHSFLGMKSRGRHSGMKKAGMKRREREHRQVERIVDAVVVQDFERQNDILSELGITPIWIDDYPEIAKIVGRILERQ